MPTRCTNCGYNDSNPKLITCPSCNATWPTQVNNAPPAKPKKADNGDASENAPGVTPSV